MKFNLFSIMQIEKVQKKSWRKERKKIVFNMESVDDFVHVSKYK